MRLTSQLWRRLLSRQRKLRRQLISLRTMHTLNTRLLGSTWTTNLYQN
jgi:hypothetical protein